MPKEQLRQRIEELEEELEQTESIDADARDRLTGVLEEIRRALAESAEKSDEEGESLVERLNEATRQFEESHPTLTTMVGRIADSLSNLGI
jgi:DNA repair exonuclease SbcCD ATPase subunit